jgi:D-alanyl-lipoteichoic acid acyltransferase DltB (MBOAT superfamily)
MFIVNMLNKLVFYREYIIIPDIILPIGISFYTFQIFGYIIAVYRGQKPIDNFFNFSLFVTYFPQLVAGPIEKMDNLYPQLFSKKRFNLDGFILGLKLMLWGFFKKVVIADRLSYAVDYVYNDIESKGCIALLIATVFFAFQIYCDFSGYCDIALGSSRLLGIRLIENFDKPYSAVSLDDFWRRWHISLTSWFRQYVYIPMGGGRVGAFRKYFNIFVVFILSGIWHGANVTFIVWGAINGFFKIIENLIIGSARVYRFRLIRICGRIITFVIVCFSWIFFRADSLKDAMLVINGISKGSRSLNIYNIVDELGMSLVEVLLSSIFMAILMYFEFISKDESVVRYFERKCLFIRSCFYLFIFLILSVAGVFTSKAQFIYFQF